MPYVLIPLSVCNENCMVCKKIVKKNTKTYSVTCRVGVLNRKYDLVGSEFKFWPSNYNLEMINLGQILNTNPARSYFPLVLLTFTGMWT